MYTEHANSSRQKLIEEIQELEDAYAEALSDNTDARTLSALWDRIKMLTYQMKEAESTRFEVCSQNGQRH